MVNSSPYSATGPIRGRNRSSYHCVPLRASPMVRVANPAASGMPRNTSTDTTMVAMEKPAWTCARPSQPGSTCR